MKFLIAGDQHRTFSCPANRTDDYGEAGMGKFRQMLTIATMNNCKAILMPGDIFDSHRVTHGTVRAYVELHNKWDGDVYVVAGQHDQRYHALGLYNTPLGVLIAATRTHLLTKTPFILESARKPVALYGAGWGEDIPEITTPDAYNVLLTHRMIIGSELAWATQTEDQYTKAVTLLENTEFDLIVSGDNHKKFWTASGKRHLFNMGSLMRSTTAQMGHRPAVYTYDTDTDEYNNIYLDVAPAEAVFRTEVVEREQAHNANMETFISTLNTEEMPDLDFVGNVVSYVSSANLDSNVEAAIAEMFNNNIKLEG